MPLSTRIFRRGWQHPDPAKRRAAIPRLTDMVILRSLACDDPDPACRRLALLRLGDEAFILERLPLEVDQAVQIAAVRSLREPPYQIDAALDPRLPNAVREAAIARVADQATLEDIALNAASKSLRLTALRKVVRAEVLEYLAIEDRSPEVRALAAQRRSHRLQATTRAVLRHRQG